MKLWVPVLQKLNRWNDRIIRMKDPGVQVWGAWSTEDMVLCFSESLTKNVVYDSSVPLWLSEDSGAWLIFPLTSLTLVLTVLAL